VIRPAWNRLVITARSGQRLTLVDELDGGDLRSIHRYVAMSALDAHVVVRTLVPEGRDVLFIDAAAGDSIRIDDVPIAAPDGTRFVTASADLIAGHEPNRIRVYHMTATGPVIEFELEPSGWGADEAVWIDGETIRLRRSDLEVATQTVTTSDLLLRRGPEGWAIAGR
jgi:hypothetical protein